MHITRQSGAMETRALCEQINKQTPTEMMAVVHYTTGWWVIICTAYKKGKAYGVVWPLDDRRKGEEQIIIYSGNTLYIELWENFHCFFHYKVTHTHRPSHPYQPPTHDAIDNCRAMISQLICPGKWGIAMQKEHLKCDVCFFSNRFFLSSFDDVVSSWKWSTSRDLCP